MTFVYKLGLGWAAGKQDEEAETAEDHCRRASLQQGSGLKPADPVLAAQAEQDADDAEQGADCSGNLSQPWQNIHLS